MSPNPGYCATCNNTGEIDCYCGGDLCVCENNGTADEHPHSEHDQYVISRARAAADAPYDQDTCRRYPWAAAARIAHLESVLKELRR